ncbi:EAL domain-containing protein [Actinoplanes sp. NPDC023714]|uniref:putative bifunctional diguanylate cyclase/phosphodiesterase n=1 Tax=Actinoplanes sp. NPDC023714 TaxID=3154322 RepID=UPI0033C0EA60
MESQGRRALPGTVLASAAIAAFAVVVFAVNFGGPRGLLLLWLPASLSTIIPVVLAVRLAMEDRLARPARIFWGHLAGCAGLVGVGAALNTMDAIGHGAPTQAMSPVTLGAYGAAVVVLLIGMFRLPLGTSGRGDRIRVVLDAGTVLLAAAVFMWQYQFRPMLQDDATQATSLLGLGAIIVVEMLIVFAIAKVALSGFAYVAPLALRMFALGLLVGAMSGMLQRFVSDHVHLNTAQVTIPLVMICATVAAEAQRRERPGRAQRRRTRKKSFSVLPYLAVVAVLVLLVAVSWAYPDLRPAVLAAAALTALVVWRQITAFRENADLVARLDHSSTHDALTGLPNRALFHQRLADALAADQPVSIALIDLDDFKTVNDTLGHGAGDALLTTVAARLRDSVREGDTVARLGGDEFVVLLAGITPAEAELLARRMIASLAEPVLADGHELLVRASIGLADGGGATRSGSGELKAGAAARSGAGVLKAGVVGVAAESGSEDGGELLRRADIAMYAAKHGGGSNVQRYSSGMAGAVADTASLGAQLRDAIAGGGLRLAFQPIMSVDGTRMRGAEALVRWQHPQRGLLAPAEFIPVAERTGLIVPLGEWVLRAACDQLAAWTADLGPLAPARISVNVSARQLSEAGFATRVADILATAGVPARRLTLEISEAVPAGPLEELRRMGVRIALDDFGTGRSSLALLHELPIDQLKLHGSLLHGDMPAAVLALAAAAGLDVVAEGVETAEQAATLAALGYRAAQGFHLAHPMTATAVAELALRLPVPAA